MHLIYNMRDACEAQQTQHPQKVMQELGITYHVATPQSMYDTWWFWNCGGIPSPLPTFLRELKIRPHDAIGYGLSRQEADAIQARMDAAREPKA